MGAGNCCAGRDSKSNKSRGNNPHDKTWDFLQGEVINAQDYVTKVFFTIASKCKTEARFKWFSSVSDIDIFDKAYAQNDVEGFIDLISSNEPIGTMNQKIHPWAADPTCIGALAITQLAILAAKDEEPQLKDRICEARAIPVLVENLNSEKIDRQHASLVALSFLSVDNKHNCIEIYKAEGYPPLIKLLSSDLHGVTGASAQICRNIYVLGKDYRKEFKKLGGIKPLVALLNQPFNEKTTELNEEHQEEEYFNNLEVIYHLEDYIMDASEEIPGMAQDIVEAGAIPYLEKLKQTNYTDLKEAAEYLLARLNP